MQISYKEMMNLTIVYAQQQVHPSKSAVQAERKGDMGLLGLKMEALVYNIQPSENLCVSIRLYHIVRPTWPVNDQRMKNAWGSHYMNMNTRSCPMVYDMPTFTIKKLSNTPFLHTVLQIVSRQTTIVVPLTNMNEARQRVRSCSPNFGQWAPLPELIMTQNIGQSFVLLWGKLCTCTSSIGQVINKLSLF